MIVRKTVLLAGACFALLFGQAALAQDLSCSDINWSSAVTDEYPNIADACDAVVQKNGKMFARIEVEIQRVRGRTLTFKILHNDGSSSGSYTQTVNTGWRAKIGGRSYRPSDLFRGQQLNVYMPSDRWAVIIEDEEDDGPDETEAVAIMAAPVLPQTASALPLFGLLGGGFMALAAGLGVIRRRLS
ncbi:MAG: hypothetical protein O7F73_20520 [Gammaproteobacteria bacterium]|nr:hypothetical protein [Gammaproteobacteria bacterium]